jgi:hypothetical protein
MKTFSYTTESGLVAPAAVADIDQLVINKRAGTFFLKFDVWASTETMGDGKPPIGELKMQLSGEDAKSLKEAQAKLYGELSKAAFVVAGHLFPEDAKDV